MTHPGLKRKHAELVDCNVPKFSGEGESAMFTVRDIYDLAIRIEENGERFYRQAIGEVSSPRLKELLLWNADEEVEHRDFFLQKKSALKDEVSLEGALAEQMTGFILRDAVSDHAFSLDEVDFSKIADEKDLIRTAIIFEQDSITFYELIGGFISDPLTLEEIEAIKEEERKHITLLEDLLGG